MTPTGTFHVEHAVRSHFGPISRVDHFVLQPKRPWFFCGAPVSAGIVEASGNVLLHAGMAHVAERHWIAGQSLAEASLAEQVVIYHVTDEASVRKQRTDLEQDREK